MHKFNLALKIIFMLMTPITASAQIAPGEDPVQLNQKIVVNMLPLNNAPRSTPAQNFQGIPAWLEAKIARFEAKAFSIDTSGIFTDKDVTTTTMNDGFRKTCIQEVGNSTALAANAVGKYGNAIQDQIVVLRGDLINICR
jgi:hypothetical protein